MDGRSFAFISFISLLFIPALAAAQSTPAPLPDIPLARAGAIEGNFQVSGTGSAAYEIPLAVPPGTMGMVPHLALSYDSHSGTSLSGAGWSLSGLSAISRCPRTIAQDGRTLGVQMNGTDALCLDGKRLMLQSGIYGANNSKYGTESDTFSRVTLFGGVGGGPIGPGFLWVDQKDGFQAQYGYFVPGYPSNNGIQLASNSTSLPLSWQLTKLTDRHNDSFSVQYVADRTLGESLPSRIDYTRNDVASRLLPYNSVRFVYEPRSFPDQNFVNGFAFGTNKRLARIQMYAGENLAWEYRLEYRRDEVSREDLLIQVTQCDAGDDCLAPTTFTYPQSSNQDPTFEALPPLFAAAQTHGAAADGLAPILTGDWNADGRTDFARVYGPTSAVTVHAFIAGAAATGFATYTNLTVSATPNHVITGDWNGDGGTDLATLSGNTLTLYLSNGTGFVNIGDVTNLSPDSHVNAIISGDWNGDGRSDFAVVTDSGVVAYTLTSSGVEFYATFSSFSPAQGFHVTCDPNAVDCSDEHELPLYAGDWNGDGRTDIARLGPNGLVMFRSTTSGFAAYVTLTQFSGPRSSLHPIIFGDWNADGLVDIARVGDTGTTTCESTGAGFAPCTTFAMLAPAQGFSNDEQNPIVTGDLNGDGRSDIARVQDNGRVIYYLSEEEQFSGPYDTIGTLPPGAHTVAPHEPFPLFTGDWGGNGVLGLARAGVDRINFVVPNFQETTAIIGINNGLGKNIGISYEPLTNGTVYRKGTGAVYPIVDVLAPIPVVRQVQSSNGIGGVFTTGYFYDGLRADQSGRGSSGFEHVTAYDFTRGITSTTTNRQDFPLQGVPILTESRLTNPTATLLHRQTFGWTTRNFSWGGFFPYVAEEVSEEYEPTTGTLVSRVAKASSFDDHGNLLDLEVTRSDDSWERTVNTYREDVGLWRLGILLSTTVTSGNTTSTPVTRTAQFTYFGQVGDLWTEVLEPQNPELALTRAHYPDYGSFGNNTEETLSGFNSLHQNEQRFERKVFDAKGQFPISVSNPLGQVTLVQYEPFRGKLIRSQDPNGLVTDWGYDIFGREIHEFRADGTEQRTLTLVPPDGSPANVAYISRVDESGTPPLITYYDALNREILRETVGLDGRSILVEHIYNDRGQLAQESQPYFRGEAPRYTVHEYDETGREIRRTEPGTPSPRQTMITYDGLTTTVTNPLGQTTRTTTNLQGKVVSSEDEDHNVVIYTYDGAGQQLTVRDPRGNTTTLTYDSRGNKIAIDEPDSGTTHFVYDAFGELKSQTNANGQTTTYSYDRLGRMLGRTRPEGVDRWVYDSAAHGIGKLAQLNAADGYQETPAYDALGRGISLTRRMGGVNFTMATSYDAYSRPATITYPSGFSVRHVYNSRGFFSEVRRSADNYLIWRAEARNARGQVERQLFGNGLRTVNTFVPTTGLVQTIKTGPGTSSTVQNLSFSFDALGNLTERRDIRVGARETFGYDDLNRLSAWQVNSANLPPVTVSYDELGNILTRSDVGTYNYGERGAGPHAVTSISGVRPDSYDYDAAGNRIHSTDGIVNFNSSGMPFNFVKGATRLMVAMAPNGGRYLEDIYDGAALRERKYIVDKYYERIQRDAAVVQRHFIHGPDGMVAIYEGDPNILSVAEANLTPLTPGKDRIDLNSQTAVTPQLVQNVSPAKATLSLTGKMLYLHHDHLGSIQTITDKSGRIVEVSSFDPWGVRRDPTTWGQRATPPRSTIDRGFTGHEQLDDVGLIHMNGRVYDPVIGRFLSPDPIVQDQTNSQNLNRYSYVLNNPLSLTDPSGYSWKSFLRRMRSFIRTAFVIGIEIAATFLTNGAVTAALGHGFFATLASGAVSSISSSIISTVAHGGSFADGFRAGLHGSPLSAIEAVVTGGIGDISNATERALAHGIAGGALSAARGGNFISGFASSLVSSGGGGQDLTRSILLGGVASSLTGGKFEEGAIRATFIHLFNDDQHNDQRAIETLNNSGPDGPNYHQYQFDSFVGLYSGPDSVARAFDLLLHYAAPGQDSSFAVRTGDVSDARAFFMGGPVYHVVDSGNLTVFNITLPGHTLDPGYVARSVVVSGRGIYIRTFGEGNGDLRLLNQYGASFAFGGADDRIRAGMFRR